MKRRGVVHAVAIGAGIALALVAQPTTADKGAGSGRPSTAGPSSPGPQATATETLTLQREVNALSWSPDGRSLVYVVGTQLRDWPRGRRLTLPFSVDDPFSSGASRPWPVAWTVKWRGDGTEMALMGQELSAAIEADDLSAHWHADAYVIDVVRFRLKAVVRNVHAVWWNGAQLCSLPEIAPTEQTPDGEAYVGARFGRAERHTWYCGGAQHQGPAGMMLTDASQGGQAMLARVAGESVRSLEFCNLAVLRLSPDLGKPVWVARVFPHSVPLTGSGAPNSDTIDWNEGKEAALITFGDDVPGYEEVPVRGSRLFVVTRDRVFRYPGASRDTTVLSKPGWVGNRVLAVELLSRDGRREYYEARYRVVLWDPWQGITNTLIETRDHRQPCVNIAAGTRDGKRIAYVLENEKQRTRRLIISDLSALRSAGS